MVMRPFSWVNRDPRDISRAGGLFLRFASVAFHALLVGVPSLALGMAVAYLAS